MGRNVGITADDVDAGAHHLIHGFSAHKFSSKKTEYDSCIRNQSIKTFQINTLK